ncbi:MAG: tryptophan--tRNA ligase [Chitinophagaceae bacterium]
MQIKEKVVSGIRPTGFLHLGNYFGAIRNYVRMQDEFDCYFFVADLHSLTTHPKPLDLKGNVFRVLAENLACGLDPQKVALYIQSDLPETLELYGLLNMIAYKGELEKTVSFKEKIKLHQENINAGLLTYPVLMAADILLQRAVKVPVGRDQEQHLEMTRNLAVRFNKKYGELFPEPQAFNFGQSLVKVPSLDGKGKMSKSENEMATVYLADSDELILKKIKRAISDEGPKVPHSPKPEIFANLFLLLQLVGTPATLQYFEEAYNDCSIRYGDLKNQLARDLIQFITPIRERALSIQFDEASLLRVIRMGAEKARDNATLTLKRAKELIGIKYY